MSQFFQDLWESIFTPGPTPSLLIATNVTFAVLQVVLLVLLYATYSIHFIILSFLSGGLWWAINWFAGELQAARDEKEEEQKRIQRRRAVVAAATASTASTDSETEVEGHTESQNPPTGRSGGVEPVERRGGEVRQRTTTGAATKVVGAQADEEADAVGAAPTISPPFLAAAAATAVRATGQGSQGSLGSSSNSQRLSGSRSGVSTEDEWEKVSENENEK